MSSNASEKVDCARESVQLKQVTGDWNGSETDAVVGWPSRGRVTRGYVLVIPITPDPLTGSACADAGRFSGTAQSTAGSITSTAFDSLSVRI